MARNINIAKVWNPNNYQDIGVWYRERGYPAQWTGSHTFNLNFYNAGKIKADSINQLFYTEIQSNVNNYSYSYEMDGFTVLERNSSYPVVPKIVFAAFIKYREGGSDRYSPFSIEFYTNYNRSLENLHDPIPNSMYDNKSFQMKLHGYRWENGNSLAKIKGNYVTTNYYCSKFYPGDDVGSSYEESLQNESGPTWLAPSSYYHYLTTTFTININNPFMPVFDNQQDLFAYLDDFENEEKASKALNYYDMSNDLTHSDERYKYKNLSNIMNSYKNKFENLNIYDFSSIDKEILTPLNNLLNTYKNIDYYDKIVELAKEYYDKSYDYIELSNMDLISSSSDTIREVEIPKQPPMIAYPSFSKFTSAELNDIKTYVENIIQTKFETSRDYMLFIDASTSFYGDSSTTAYNKISIIAAVGSSNNDFNYINVGHNFNGTSSRLSYRAYSTGYYYNNNEYNTSMTGTGFSFIYDIEEKTFSHLSGGTSFSVGGSSERALRLTKSGDTFDIYGSNQSIYINEFNDKIPFYATNDFYLKSHHSYCVSNSYEDGSSRYDNFYTVNGLNTIPEGWVDKTSDDLGNGVVEDTYIYNTAPEGYHFVRLRHIYNADILFFKATPNIDPYANLPTTSAGMVLIKPVISIFNRYEMSNINGWDGNKLKIADGYLLSPQIGAGKKTNGLFTGIVMGVKQIKPNSSENQRIGMFGFNGGVQSLFLNAEDGSAIFGLPGKGQITIDPKLEKGLLYSGNYWKDYNDKDGKPKSYSNSNLNGQGMLIDLTTPEIRFGNGNFIVTKDGYVTARGGGSIAGWRIGNSELYSNVNKSSGRLTLDSGSITLYAYELPATIGGDSVTLKIYCLVSSESQTAKIFYIKDEYNNIKDSFNFQYTEPQGSTPGFGILEIFGYYYSQYNLGDLNLTSDTLVYNYVSGKSVVDTASNYQYPGKIYSHSHDSLAATNQGFYLSYDGFSIGSKFKVNSSGLLEAEDVNLSGTINVRGDGASKIGSWTVNSDNLYSRITRTSVPAGTFDITIGSDGNLFGKKLISTDPETGVETWEPQWEIRRDGDAYFKNIYGTVPSGKTLNILGSLEVTGTADIATLNVNTIKINNVALSSHTAKAVTSVSSADIKDGDGNTVRVLTGISLTDSITFVTK